MSRPLPILPSDPILADAAGAQVLLVACDFDGTLSPIAPRPQDAAAEAASIEDLRRLSRLPRTYTAVISGRGLDDLRTFIGDDRGLHLVGSHGAESDFWSSEVGSHERELIGTIRDEIGRIAARYKGALAETKPLGCALHVRLCDREDAAKALREVLDGPAKFTGVHVLEGHAIIELGTRPQNKGSALAALKHRLGITRAFFIGDDRTDEFVFEMMDRHDIGVRIGGPPTAARYSVGSQSEVAPLLESLMSQRTAALYRESPVPITSHALLSDLRTVALVDDRGAVSWMCLPSADSGSLFGHLLGSAGGLFRVSPAGSNAAPGKQEYVGDSMIARTSWPGLSVTDYLDCSGGRAYQRAGRTDLIRFIEGGNPCEIHFEPRPDFGRGRVSITPIDGGLRVETGSDIGVLLSPGIQWTIRPLAHGEAAHAEFTPDPRGTALEWRWGQGGAGPSPVLETTRRAQTERFWSGWAASLTLPKVASDAVKRSAVVLRSLCHGPTGAILAAATTSLPEQFGGVRNWDYRFCWPRDACLSARALLNLGNSGVAMKLLDWLVGVVATAPSPDRLRPIYTVAGGPLSPEAEITALAGYHRSAPVRIGNAADNQVQLDVFGPIVDLVASLAERGTPVTPEHWRLVRSMVEAVEMRWREPDHGIWEIRGPKQRHVHSAVMCWLAAKRGADVAQDVVGKPAEPWTRLADEIRNDLLEHGFNRKVNAFTGTYGGDNLDAAALWVVLSGLLPPDDPRAVSTVRTVRDHLLRGPVVYRYLHDDSIPGLEGGFVIASFWLAEALCMIGEKEAAQDLFNRAAALAGPCGLLAEQHEPHMDLPLGNYPQAYSHLGLINAAVRLSSR